MSKNNGGRAFPKPASPPDGVNHDLEGMDLRDYFAAKALPAVLRACSNDLKYRMATDGWTGFEGIVLDDDEDETSWADCIAEQSYIIADAMLAARDAESAQ